MDDCMFRFLDIVDPEHPESGAIVKLEHEIRSDIRLDRTMYQSCPFREIPEECKILERKRVVRFLSFGRISTLLLI